MFLGRSSADFPEMARCRHCSGVVWIHQSIWRLLPCGVGISETVTRNWPYPSRTVYWTGTHYFTRKTLIWLRRWIDWLDHDSCLYDLIVLGWRVRDRLDIPKRARNVILSEYQVSRRETSLACFISY